MPYDCFISYANNDREHAEAIFDCLTAVGLNVWFDKARLRPGFNWHQEIEEACESSRILLPVLTPLWKRSEWTRFETYGAETVIPVIVKGKWADVSTPPLGRHQGTALPLAEPTEKDWQRLIDSIHEHLRREAPKHQRVVHVRYLPNPHFVGREYELAEIHESLFLNPTAALTQGHIRALAALGGVGKTTLARQYVEKFWRCYGQIFWANCAAGIAGEFARIYEILNPDDTSILNEVEKAEWVRRYFSKNDSQTPRLLVLDDAQDEEAILKWLPSNRADHTLVTSRFSAFSPGITTHQRRRTASFYQSIRITAALRLDRRFFRRSGWARAHSRQAGRPTSSTGFGRTNGQLSRRSEP